MRIYSLAENQSTTLYVTPASDPRAATGGIDSDWLGPDGAPRMFSVNFKDGKADVADPLGRYLCATGQAKRTRLWLPSLRIARAA